MLKEIVSLFLLKTGLVSGHIKNLLEDYIETNRVILSDWKDYSWKVWYKEIPYFFNKLFDFQKFTDSSSWKVIQWDMNKTAKFTVGDYNVLFNRSGKIRYLGDISAGNNFLILYKKGWDLPCICILRNKSGESNNIEMYNRMLQYVANSDYKNLIKLINMYCHVYPMYSLTPVAHNRKNERVYTFGIQDYTEGVINDGLYVKESEVKGNDKGNFIIF